MLGDVKLEHKLVIVAGSLAAPGFAQALAGRKRAAGVWICVEIVLTLLATNWMGFPALALAWRLAAGVAAIVEVRRFEAPPRWRSRLSLLLLFGGVGAFVLFCGSLGSYRIPTSSMYPTIQIGDYVMVDELSVRWRAPERGEIVFFAYPCARDITYVKRVIAIGGDTIEIRCSIVYVNGEAIRSELVTESETYEDYDPARRAWRARSTSVYREQLGGHSYEVFHDAGRAERDRDRAAGIATGGAAGDLRDFPQRDRMLLPSCGQSEFYDTGPSTQPLAGSFVVTKQDASACEPQAHFVVPRGGLFVLGDNRTNAMDSRVWGVVPVDAVVGRAMGIWLSHPPGSDPSFGRAGSIH